MSSKNADSLVHHPELLRSWKVGPKSQNEYLMEHMGFKTASRSAPGLEKKSKPSTPASTSSTASSVDTQHVPDPYARAAINGPPIVSAELSSHVAMSS
mmetsp:Transcript_90849/g.261778  ORF Transcript_90849/g.261778 Transcript_90849/m.261778 type:complete len:98 (+) Transcript_90849:62-355(+)